MPLHPAAEADFPAAVALVNLAYRGTEPAWNTEAGYIVGDRLTLPMLREDLAACPGAELLLWRDGPAGPIDGCVWLEPGDGALWRLGLLTVRPGLQARRLGRTIREAAEDIARAAAAPSAWA
jgi:hypothetical protein